MLDNDLRACGTVSGSPTIFLNYVKEGLVNPGIHHTQPTGRHTICTIQVDVLLDLSHLECDEGRVGITSARMEVGEDLTRFVGLSFGVEPSRAKSIVHQHMWVGILRKRTNIPLWAPEHEDTVESSRDALHIQGEPPREIFTTACILACGHHHSGGHNLADIIATPCASVIYYTRR